MYTHKNSLVFSPLQENHLEELAKLKSNSWATTHQTVYLDRKKQRDWFDSMNERNQYMVLSLKSTQDNADNSAVVGGDVAFMGLTGINSVSRVAGITASLFPSYRGKDYSQKVWESVTDFGFEMFNLNRIECEVLSNNIVSLKKCISVGYKVEGTRRQAVYKSGIYLDSYMLGLLRTDWRISDRVEAMGGICNYDARMPNVSQMFEAGSTQ